jgi:hypothetical protein
MVEKAFRYFFIILKNIVHFFGTNTNKKVIQLNFKNKI